MTEYMDTLRYLAVNPPLGVLIRHLGAVMGCPLPDYRKENAVAGEVEKTFDAFAEFAAHHNRKG